MSTFEKYSNIISRVLEDGDEVSVLAAASFTLRTSVKV